MGLVATAGRRCCKQYTVVKNVTAVLQALHYMLDAWRLGVSCTKYVLCDTAYAGMLLGGKQVDQASEVPTKRPHILLKAPYIAITCCTEVLLYSIVCFSGASKNKTLGYDWAIITGGNASNATGKGCIPTARGDNGKRAGGGVISTSSIAWKLRLQIHLHEHCQVNI